MNSSKIYYVKGTQDSIIVDIEEFVGFIKSDESTKNADEANSALENQHPPFLSICVES